MKGLRWWLLRHSLRRVQLLVLDVDGVRLAQSKAIASGSLLPEGGHPGGEGAGCELGACGGGEDFEEDSRRVGEDGGSEFQDGGL